MPAAVSSITRHTVGRTFIIAITILGAGAIAQMSAIGWLFFARFHVPPDNAAPGPAVPGQSVSRDFTDPLFAEVASLPGATASVTATPPPAPPRPAPLSPSALGHAPTAADTTPDDRVSELVDQGRLLRDRKDYYAAVTKLREAQVLGPTNPAPLYELAMTYEKMGFTDPAAETWKKIYDMGSAAGVYYSAAEAKLNASKAQALLEAQPGEAPPGDVAPPAQNQVVGLGPAAKLGFASIERTEGSDPQLLEKINFAIAIKAKARARIDAADVAVKVLFYDLVPDPTTRARLDGTNANIHSEWESSPADWSERDVETLNITYARLRPAQGEPLDERKYYGYIAAIYYKNALQDFRSDPPRLAQKQPPPRALSE